MTVTCGRCGTQAECEENSVPMGWSLETERKRVVRYCDACLRENIRSIEAKLPEEWWG